MPVVGFHQARRPRSTPAERLSKELSWPRPGGVALSLAGGVLVICGALSLTPAVQESSEGAAVSPPRTTAAPSQAPSPPSAAASSGDATSSATGNIGDNHLDTVTDPNSTLVLVNKRNPLIPANFTPQDLVTPNALTGSGETALLRAEASLATENMFSTAAGQGIRLRITSSYRSYETQVSVYNGYVADKGVAGADSTSARPGFSEHQTGLAIDIGDANDGPSCDFQSCFADTAAGQWAAAHGADYGFIVRYQPGQEVVTGYLAEPWHLRYVGVAVAQDMQRRGIGSYEEYLGLPAAPDYK